MLAGDLALAQKVMARLGYSASMIAAAGPDAYNYQGVGCPHNLAGISQGWKIREKKHILQFVFQKYFVSPEENC